LWPPALALAPAAARKTPFDEAMIVVMSWPMLVFEGTR